MGREVPDNLLSSRKKDIFEVMKNLQKKKWNDNEMTI
jgi:hypothetical protein